MKHHTIAVLLSSAALLGSAMGVQAQTIYRIVGAGVVGHLPVGVLS